MNHLCTAGPDRQVSENKEALGKDQRTSFVEATKTAGKSKIPQRPQAFEHLQLRGHGNMASNRGESHLTIRKTSAGVSPESIVLVCLQESHLSNPVPLCCRQLLQKLLEEPSLKGEHRAPRLRCLTHGTWHGTHQSSKLSIPALAGGVTVTVE